MSAYANQSEQEKAAALGSDARAHAPAAHGRPNEGGICDAELETVVEASSPRLVIRGESLDNPHPLDGGESYRLVCGYGGKAMLEATPLPRDGVPAFAALTDWLNVTFPFVESSEGISKLVRQVNEYLSPKFGGLKDRFKGLHGFTHSFLFDDEHTMFAYGGQRGKAMLSIPGEGCALISDWGRAYSLLKDQLRARISRWDGAVDDFEGRFNVDTALEWFLGEKFNTHGNQPKMKQAGNWAKPDGSGRTLYLGNRKNGKMLRVYEKGKQLGDPNSLWVRWELELKNKSRVVPLEVLLHPGPYVAGSYACLGWIDMEASRVKTIQKTAHISYDHLTHWLRLAYGQHLNVMNEIEGSPEAVLAKLIRPGMPKRLQLPDIDLPSSGV